MIEFPSDEEILDFTERQRIGESDVVLRDLARIATIFHLREEGFLGSETVLVGRMALRCYGGHRFTVTDVDTSTKADVKMGTLDGLLNWEIEDQLEVSTKGVGWYEKGVDLEKAKPILFDPLFSEIQLSEPQAQFELTVNRRGLELEPVEREFRHDFPWQLGVEGKRLPLMDPREMLAEKVLGWGATRKPGEALGRRRVRARGPVCHDARWARSDSTCQSQEVRLRTCRPLALRLTTCRRRSSR